MSQMMLKKVFRWAVTLIIYNYICVHIKGKHNVWAEILSLWLPSQKNRIIINITPLTSTVSKDLEWPTPKEFWKAQDDNLHDLPYKAIEEEGL